jgi:hypothetical protein
MNNHMTGYAQTRLSWARRVSSYGELPDVYHVRLKASLGNRPLPHAVLTPTYPGFIRRENEKLVFSLDQHLHVWERTKSGLTCACYALEDIHSVESGSILLYAWIGIHGVASHGGLVKSILRFNSITAYLFAPFVDEIRGASGDLAGVDREPEIQKLDRLSQPSFKFRNYARRSLLPGEQVIDALWQPEIRHKLLTLLGQSFYRTIATTHLLVLTDRELIVLREDEESQRWRDESRYGGVWMYIPLDKIASITLTKTDMNLLTLSVHLPQNDCIESLFVDAQQPAVDRFLSRIASTTSRIAVTRELVG